MYNMPRGSPGGLTASGPVRFRHEATKYKRGVMDDISDLMSAVETHIIDALDKLDDLLYLIDRDPQTEEAKHDVAELYDFYDTVEKAYNRAKSVMNEIEG